MDPATCVGFGCRVWATWDFTGEARALVEQGGGPLELALDPVPAVRRLSGHPLHSSRLRERSAGRELPLAAYPRG